MFDRNCAGRQHPFFAAIGLTILLAVGSPVLAAELIYLGDLPGGETLSQTWGVSADGTTVTGYSKGYNLYIEAFRWTRETGMVPLGSLPGGVVSSSGFGVSSDGSHIVGQSHVEGGAEAFLWTASTGMVGLGDLSSGYPRSIAYAISLDGSTVVGSGNNHSAAFVWSNTGGMVGIGDLPGGNIRSEAFAVSGDGTVVVGQSSSADGEEAFKWTAAGGMIGLGFPASANSFFQSNAAGVSEDGTRVCGIAFSGNTWDAFLWTESDGMVTLGDVYGNSPSVHPTQALAISADGQVVVGSSSSEAFIWDATNGMRTLASVLTEAGVDLTGWQLQWATGVSASGGAVAGYGQYNGHTSAFLAVLDTAPKYSCVGFKPPADQDVVVRKANRVVPLRMELRDEYGVVASTNAAPVLQVSYSSGGSLNSYAEELLYAGRGDEGNTFIFNGTDWGFNLSTRGLAPGTYALTAVSGDETEYVINPSCTVTIEVH